MKYDRNMTYIQQLAQDHVDILNEVFISQVFNFGSHTDRYFRLARLQVMFGSCNKMGSIRKCKKNSDFYLNNFDADHDFSNFCLTFIFTDRLNPASPA